MTQPDQTKQNGTGTNQRPDPEVVPRPAQAERRTFTAEYKAWLLEEAEKCRTEPGGIGALLRREGLYSSHLARWRRQQERGKLQALTPQKRGRKAEPEAQEVQRLRQENARLVRQLEKAELIIEAQKKLSEALGITLEREADGTR
jgi:transposase-like protein